jgi:hypothetical protein
MTNKQILKAIGRAAQPGYRQSLGTKASHVAQRCPNRLTHLTYPGCN